jgi:hypothetical protein
VFFAPSHSFMTRVVLPAKGSLSCQVQRLGSARAWEKQVPSARGFKRVGRHSEHPI